VKLRLVPILVSLCVSAAVLFGGWFIYRSVAMENPLLNIIHQTPGVEQVEMDLGNSEVNLRLKLKPDASLREIVSRLHKDGAPIIGTRKLNITVDNDSSAELDRWWSGMLFQVAQDMDKKTYADIPAALKSHESELPGLKTDTEMDEENVYIRLNAGNHSKFIILKRVPERMGVWPNEQVQ